MEPTEAVQVGNGGGGGGGGVTGVEGGLLGAAAAVTGVGGLAEEAKSLVEVAIGAGLLFGNAAIGTAGLAAGGGVAVVTGVLPCVATGGDAELILRGGAPGFGVVTTTAEAGGVLFVTATGGDAVLV